MHFKPICPTQSQVWDQPENAGFDEDEIVSLLEELRTRGHDYELVDVDALEDEQRSELYEEAMLAVAHSGNRYRIRHVFGSRRHGGGEHLGKGVPALIVYEDEVPVDVYPHQASDGYQTIHVYLTELVSGQALDYASHSARWRSCAGQWASWQATPTGRYP